MGKRGEGKERGTREEGKAAGAREKCEAYKACKVASQPSPPLLAWLERGYKLAQRRKCARHRKPPNTAQA